LVGSDTMQLKRGRFRVAWHGSPRGYHPPHSYARSGHPPAEQLPKPTPRRRRLETRPRLVFLVCSAGNDPGRSRSAHSGVVLRLTCPGCRLCSPFRPRKQVQAEAEGETIYDERPAFDECTCASPA